MTELSLTVGHVRLRNPILTASGTFGYGEEYQDFQNLSALGGLVTKGLTLEARPGNPPRRIAETPAGMLNSVGLQNVGLNAFLAEKLPKMRGFGTAIIANLNGRSLQDYVELARLLSAAEGISGFELNVSCPNVKCGGLEFGQDAGVLYPLVSAVRQATRLPLWVKLSPVCGQLGELGRACEAGGADAIVAINTVPGAHVQPVWEDGRLRSQLLKAGLSGPAIKPIALRSVWEIRQAVKLPVVGVGGICNVEDVVEFLALGAQAVQVGTANFYDPTMAVRLPSELAAILGSRGVARVEDLSREVFTVEPSG